MKKEIFMLFGVFSLALALALPVRAGEGLIETVANGCKNEIKSYCKNVTTGEG